ncbi:flagellar basal body-associated FliL family protein [Ferrimicrobium acidiphilum]|uniref:flagellar basal body-associated FliL family protein n=1 Tax=Ferrimicrobium acidiphilum TaxID=121039 RepID=UPI0023F4B903|nr:flagellar basal body-associated FliL family protein [Ferrimicrobium acidiphilum]
MATRMAPAEATTTEEPKKKGKKKLLLIIVLVVLLAAAAAYFLLLKKPAKTIKGAKTAAELTSVSYAMPAITTNLDDGHIVQAQMLLELAPGDTKAEVIKDLPQLNNAAILTFGGMGYSELLPTAGRTQAAVSLTNAFNAVLHTGAKPWDTVQSILFESFIVQ